MKNVKNFGILNERWLDEMTLTSGQPTSEQFDALAADGIEVVINIAPFDMRYSINDEEGLLRSRGVEYHFLPVDFKAPRLEDFLRFCEIFRETTGRRRIVHCAANYRVSAFVSYYKMAHDGWSAEQVDAWIASIWNPAEFPVWRDLLQTIRNRLEVGQSA